MITSGQQASAVETARRIVVGAVKVPRSSSSEGRLLAEQLAAAATTLRGMEAKR